MKTKHTALLLIAALSLFALPSYAQEQAVDVPAIEEKAPNKAKIKPLDYPDTYLYQPEYCDFRASFPEKPLINTACEKEDAPETCFEMTSYTKVFDMSTTVGVKVICNPANEKMYEYFKPEVMEDTVRKMTESSVLETFNVNTTEKEGYRLTGLVGQGKKGLDKTLFIAQLWISENSIMSVEAEISGNKIDEADALFAGLLNHIGYAKEMNPAPEESKKPE